jgi:dTDP-4-dehydrorhamnose reductase
MKLRQVPPMKIFIIGIGGQLGGKLASYAFAEGFEVHGGHKSRSWSEGLKHSVPFDKTEKDSVSKILSYAKPDVVVDTGALHNVDYCETHPYEAMAVNATGTLNVAETCAKEGSRFVFVSTDFVFDGIDAPYVEEASPAPLGVYARSKLQGEKYTLASRENVVVRPSVIYSWVQRSKTNQVSASGKPINFAAWLVSQLNAKKPVQIVNDQIASPTLADDLAQAILAIVKSRKTGLFHTAGTTPMSRYEFSIKVAKKLGLDESLIHAISSSELRQTAKRPSNSSLISDRISREVGYAMMPIDRALDLFADEATTEVAS